jgi:hypothetical protein
MLLLADTVVRCSAAAACCCCLLLLLLLLLLQPSTASRPARGPWLSQWLPKHTSPAKQLNMFDQWFRNQAELACEPYALQRELPQAE